MSGNPDRGASERLTRGDDILDILLFGALFPAPFTFLLLPQLWKDQRSHTLNNSWEDRVPRVEEPRLSKSRVVKVDTAFEHRVLGYAQITPNRRHMSSKETDGVISQGIQGDVSEVACDRVMDRLVVTCETLRHV